DRVDDTGSDEIAKFTGSSVVPFPRSEVLHLRDDDVPLLASVLCDPARRFDNGFGHCVDARKLITRGAQAVRQRAGSVHQCSPATSDDAFFDRCAGGGNCVLDAQFALLLF
ncbi:hypothetical protein RZS08_41050, partial [Arthrospira platensis SPKY1]|nr:hypothetical protein [Arthrospira platensis SPKY1]